MASMLKGILGAAVLLASFPALSQGLQPGEWRFDTTMTSPMFPKPQSHSIQRCVTKDEAKDPEKWAGPKKQQSDCKMTMQNKGARSASWQIECPKTSMRGSGSARIGRGTMESEQTMSGDMQGQKFEMHIKTTGTRLGPCKS